VKPLLPLLIVFSGLLSSLLLARPVWAETRTPPQATQHALDELANCIAQRRPECPTSTPTPSATPSSMPSPTSTSTALPAATDTFTPTVTPEPCWFIDQDLGDPDNAFIVFDEAGAPIPCPTDTAVTDAVKTPPTDTAIPTPSSTPTPRPAAVPAAVPAPQRRAPAGGNAVSAEHARCGEVMQEKQPHLGLRQRTK